MIKDAIYRGGQLMDQKVTEIRYEQWRRTVSECINRKAGISKRQWCDENGIRYRSLMYWQRKFQQEAIERMDNDHSLLPGQAVQVCTPVFADVTAKYEAMTEQQVISPHHTDDVLFTPELMIQAGPCRIYVSGSVQKATLEKVMQVIPNA